MGGGGTGVTGERHERAGMCDWEYAEVRERTSQREIAGERTDLSTETEKGKGACSVPGGGWGNGRHYVDSHGW
jgi:hypothetical protein